jgi:hypothetical protein
VSAPGWFGYTIATVFTFGRNRFVNVPNGPSTLVWLPFRKYAFFAVGSAAFAVTPPMIGFDPLIVA